MDGDMFRVTLIAWARLQAQTLKPKKCRRVGVGGLLRELKAELPENGTGPIVSARRAAVQLLESNCRICGKCAGKE